MRINDAFPSNFIKASDLQGRDVQVTISKVEIEDVGREKDRKPVVYFRGKEKGLVLNKTNSNTISKLYGEDTDGWINKPIVIFPTETEFGGETVECIRIRLKPTTNGAAPVQAKPAPVAAAPVHEPIDEDDIPF